MPPTKRKKKNEKMLHKKKTKAARNPMVLVPVDIMKVPLPAHALEVIEKNDRKEADRKKLDIAARLNIIHERIKIAYENAGMVTNIYSSSSEREMLQKLQRKPPTAVFDIKEKKKRIAEQHNMMELVKTYLNGCEKRLQLMKEVEMWLDSCNDLEEDCLSPEQLEAKGLEIQVSHLEILNALEFAKEAGEKLKVLGHKVMVEAGLIEEDDPSVSSEKKQVMRQLLRGERVIPKEALDETKLLSDPNNMEVALKTVSRTLDDASRVVKGNVKIVLRNGARQFRFIKKAVAMRQEQIEQKDQELLKMGVEVDRLTNAAERLKRENEEKGTRLETLDAQIDQLNMTVNRLQESMAAGEIKYQECEKKLKILQEEKQKQEKVVKKTSKTRSIVTLVKSDSSRAKLPKRKESVIRKTSEAEQMSESKSVKQNFIAGHPVVEALKEEIQYYKNLAEEKENEKQVVEKQMKQNLEKVAKLEMKVDSLTELTKIEQERIGEMTPESTGPLLNLQMRTLYQKNDTLERQVERLLQDLKMKDELIQFQESRLGEVKAEYQLMMVLEDIQRSISDHEGAAGSRGSEKKSGKSQNDIAKLINKLKNEYEGEVNRLKDFVHKEKQRSEATIRKVEAQHKEQLLGIHKESIHLLRAINRFKDTVAQILDKENLPDAAYYVRQLANLPTEEVPSDAKFLLGQMASNAVELLVAIEFKLSQALLNKRFEIKDNTIAKAFANKDLETIMAVLKKVKHSNQQMTDELRQTKQQLSAAEEALKGIRNEENTKYGSLTDRYKRLWGQFNALQKDYQLLEQNVLTKTNRTIAMKEMIKERKGKLQKELQAHKEMVKEMQKQQYSQSSVPGLTSLPEMRPCSQCKDYKKKLELLESSYRQSKISQERYEETKRLLEKSMDVAGVRLQRLFTRYVIFCRINGIKAKLLKYLETENLLPERHDKVNLYVQNMDQKLSLLSERWACEDEKMEMIRSLLNSELDHVFRNIVSELELPSAHSIILEFTTELPQLTPPVSNHTEKCERSGIQQVPPSSRGVFLPPLGKTSGIIGKCALTKVATEPCWQVASSLDTDELTSVTVTDLPRLVEMDMQDTRIRAGHRKSRSFFPLSKAEFCDYAWNPKESETRKTYQEINF